MDELKKFIKDQLSVWPLAAANFRSVKTAEVKTFSVFGHDVRVQFNPCRITSSTAEVDPASIAARLCFLCAATRPKEQFHLKFIAKKGRRYNIQINPYPIFPDHLVIVREEHIPQAIWHHFPDMIEFTRVYPGFTAFYNGPRSGASAPDHLHFQACPRSLMPLEAAADAFLDAPGEPLSVNRDATLYQYPGYCRGVFALKATTAKSLAKLFYRLLCCCDAAEMKEEPKFNLFTWRSGEEFRSLVMLRSDIRSHHYYDPEEKRFAMSPGAADMAGYFVAPRATDFERISAGILEEMLSEVVIDEKKESEIIRRLTRPDRKIDVGIMSGREIVFEIISDGAGPQKVSWADGRINYNGTLYDELYFESVTRSTLFAEASFILHDVTIGIDFHWQRHRDLAFAGGLKFIVEGDRITAINHISLENYLLSVISSEMNSDSPLELLKAHAVISRSWVLRRVLARAEGLPGLPHEGFDVCADDHCQRYQGLTMVAGDKARKAVDETWGETLKYDGGICDTRYSKCCGGLTERFSACWEDIDFPYLKSVEDPWCDCEDSSVLSTVLNDYDLETRDFHNWTARYGIPEISALIEEKSGRHIGTLKALTPLERGDSGRIVRLLIEGSEDSFEVSKELEIRRVLSPTHLKSSWFDARFEGGELILEGRGWGHGVGLCQIGAAAMAAAGKTYREILEFYYTGAYVE